MPEAFDARRSATLAGRLALRFLGISLAPLALVACGSERISTGSAPPPVVATRPVGPAADLTGRWALTAAGTTCAMSLGGGMGAAEGAIRPEGGCPGKFFTSRKWTFENGALTIRSHTGEALAQVREIVSGRFEGQATNGQPVSLVR